MKILFTLHRHGPHSDTATFTVAAKVNDVLHIHEIPSHIIMEALQIIEDCPKASAVTIAQLNIETPAPTPSTN